MKIEILNNYLLHFGIKIKHEELEDVKRFTSVLCGIAEDIRIFDGFYVGYKIPQIGKEFDLLRFGLESIVNIEMKKASTEEKIKKQLVRNRYYLSYLEKKIYSVCYVSEKNAFYFLKNDDSLVGISASSLEEILRKQKPYDIENVDYLFNPSNYLVSPFNSTDRFLGDQYFLTHQQEDVKEQILKSISQKKLSNFISIVGGAGTGKTLLVYDIAKSLRNDGKKPLVIHCGYLNEGQEELKSKGWEIIPIKSYAYYDLSAYDLIVIDEAQRIYPNQLEKIVEAINVVKGNCLFSYDKLQTLAKWEEARDINSKISKIDNIVTYKLSEKIRTNKEIANFIRMLFNENLNLDVLNKGNIEINYFNNIEDAKCYLSSLDSNVWEVLRFTPSQYHNEHHEQYSELSKKTSHKVIGQEFDGVAVTIDKYFTYSRSGELDYLGDAYYHPVKMLFQNITRARKRVNIVIIGNEYLLNRCVSILQ